MKKYGVYLMGLLYIAAGINHFINPAFYIKMVAGILPAPVLLVQLSGIAEILCGVGLLLPYTRVWAAWGTIALLVAVFPANVNMALHPQAFGISAPVLYLRLPLQLVFIYWAYIYTKQPKT